MKIFKKIDYERHFWMGFGISFVTFFVLDNLSSVLKLINIDIEISRVLSIILTAVIPIIAGIGKEIYDLKVKKTKFDKKDLKFTIIGGLIFPLFLVLQLITYHFS